MHEPDPNTMTVDEIDALLKDSVGIAVEQPMTPAEENAIDTALEAPPEPEAPQDDIVAPEPEAPPEREIDWRARAEKAEQERNEARKHSARLSGEIGYLKARTGSGDGADLDSPMYATDQEERLQRLEQERETREAERLAAIDREELAKADRLMIGVDPDITQQVVTKYAADWRLGVQQETDGERRAEAARTLAAVVVREANEAQIERQRQRSSEVRQAASTRLAAAKRSAMVSGGGSVAPRAKPKTYDEMSPAELDAEMVKEFGR